MWLPREDKTQAVTTNPKIKTLGGVGDSTFGCAEKRFDKKSKLVFC